MTDTSEKLRSLTLAALMLLSVVAGSVAFTGGALAASGSISADSEYATSDASFTVSDSDNPNPAVVAFYSDSEGIGTATEDFAGDGSKVTFTVANTPLADTDQNGAIAGDEVTVTVDGESGISVSSVDPTTGAVTLSSAPNSTDDGTTGADVHITYDYYPEANTNVDASSGSASTSIPLATSDASGDLFVSDGDVVTAAYWDPSAGTYRFDTLTANMNPGAPKVVSAIEAGGDIEVAFSEGVTKTTSDADLDANEVTVYVDGVEQTGLSYGASSSGRMVISGLGDIDPNQEVVVNINTINDSVDVQSTPGNVTVDVTSDILTLDSTASGPATLTSYEGSSIAVEFSGPNVAYERLADDRFEFSGSSGVNSHFVVFDTTDQNTSATHKFKVDTGTDGKADTNAGEVTLRQLGLDASVDSTDITSKDSLSGTVTANAGNRDVVVTLTKPDDSTTSQTVTLDGNGEATFDFGSFTTEGNYSVEVTDVQTGASVDAGEVSVEKVSGSATFENRVVNDERGDVVAIPVDLANAKQATVSVGSEDIGYLKNVTVEDGDADGEVVLLFNTNTLEYSVEGDDDEIVGDSMGTGGVSPGDILDKGDYNLEVRTGADASADAQDVGTLVLEERATNSMSIWTAPDGTDAASVADVAAAIEDGSLTLDSSVTTRDQVVVQLSASGLEGTLDSDASMNATEEFFAEEAKVGDGDANTHGAFLLSINQTNPSPNKNPKVLDLNTGNTQVITDADNDTYYLAIDLSEVTAYRVDDNSLTATSIEAGDKFHANFTVRTSTGLAEEQQTVASDFEVVEGTHTIDDGSMEVSAAENQTISGTSTFAPGTELTVRVSSTGDTQPKFLKIGSATVDADGTWSADFDFSAQSENDTYEVKVSGAGVTVTEDEGAVTAAAPDDKGKDCATPTATAADGDGDGCPGTVTDEPATTTEQPPETTTDDQPVTTTDDAPISETPETETPADDTPEDSNSPVPGFGVTVAIVALVAAALLALRRD